MNREDLIADLFGGDVEKDVQELNERRAKQFRKKPAPRGARGFDGTFDIDDLPRDEKWRYWKQEFSRQFTEATGRRLVTGNAFKEAGIFKHLVKEFSPDEIQGMIDFLFQSGQDIVPVNRLTYTHLSGGWIQTFYTCSLDYREGTYVPDSAPKRNREWVASVKPEGSVRPVNGSSDNTKSRTQGTPAKKIKKTKKIWL